MTFKNALLSLVFSIAFVLPTFASNNVPVVDIPQEIVYNGGIVITVTGVVEGDKLITVTGDNNKMAKLIVIDEFGNETYSRIIRGGDSFVIPSELLPAKHNMVIQEINNKNPKFIVE